MLAEERKRRRKCYCFLALSRSLCTQSNTSRAFSLKVQEENVCKEEDGILQEVETWSVYWRDEFSGHGRRYGGKNNYSVWGACFDVAGAELVFSVPLEILSIEDTYTAHDNEAALGSRLAAHKTFSLAVPEEGRLCPTKFTAYLGWHKSGTLSLRNRLKNYNTMTPLVQIPLLKH